MDKSSIVIVTAGIALVGVGLAGSIRPAAVPGQNAAPSSFVVRNVRVFDGTRILPRANVLVRNGSIVSIDERVSQGAETGVEIVEGEGRTLLPGLIDAHTHAFGDALARALVFGVTTELDMFTDAGFARSMRAEQAQSGGAATRADLLSAGTLVTAPGGHGTEYGMKIPTLASAADAAAFVDARIAEGSDYIKIISEDGSSYGMRTATLDLDTVTATIAAAKHRGKLAVVHVGSLKGAMDALGAGASGLVHIFADAAPGREFIDLAARGRAFVTPTLSVIESTTGVASGASLLEDPRIGRFVTPPERASLGASFPRRSGSKQNLAHAIEAVRLLHDAGVPILAGTDAPNPGTAHGSSMHREMELLVRAGLTPLAALAAATSVPATVFKLTDRGRIAPGMRADLVLVEGDPTADIKATRAITGVWKRGVRVERQTAPAAMAAPGAATLPAQTTTGIVSDFESGESKESKDPRAQFGAGWQISTDSLMGGTSTAAMKIVPGGANNTNAALEVSGRIVEGSPFPWAGAMFFPATTPMMPVDLSRFKDLVFWVRGDGGEHLVMLFATKLGNIPASRPFTAGPEWREVVLPLASFPGIDGSDLRGVLFSAAPRPGAFRFVIDEVRFR